MEKNKRNVLTYEGRSQPVITWAGMRRDSTRADNNAAVPSDESLLDEIKWRIEHIQ